MTQRPRGFEVEGQYLHLLRNTSVDVMQQINDPEHRVTSTFL